VSLLARSVKNVLCLLLLIASKPVLAGTVKECKVTFETVGKPVLVQIQGSSGMPCTGNFDVQGDKLVNAKFAMNVTSLDTGIELRNKHLKENYLHTEKFPEASLSIDNISDLSKQLKGNSGEKSKFTPVLTLRGKSAPISGATYEILGKTVKSEFRIELTDFDIERPMFMGIKVVDSVIVRVQFEMGN
jgi:polyisoprenoid-binding protein YceI